MKLYNLPPAPNPRRVRIFLAEKGVEVPTVDLDITKNEHRTPEFLAINPLAALPVLELDDGTVIAESIAICRYFEELHPQPPMFGRSVLERAQVEMWTRRIELGLMRAITDHFVHGNDFWKGRREQIPEYAELARGRALASMEWLDGELAQRAFIAGEDYTVADITAQCALLLGKNTGIPIPPERMSLTRWWASVTSRPTARA
jgi:glutathione S-transferase